MALGLARQDLLYVTNANAEVTVYQYWKHNLVGVLTDFTQPMGECADANSNVYIIDAGTQQILEYSHGGTKPIRQFDDSPNAPYSCSVDPVGNLAVTNDNGTSQPGNVAVWKKGSSSPTLFTDSQLYYFRGCAYDGSGNLLVTNGGRYPYGTSFAWLPRGGDRLIGINVPGPDPSRAWFGIDGIQWDGKYFTLDYSDVYRIALIHGQAYYVGKTTLGSGSYSPFWIYNNGHSSQGTQVVGAVSDGVYYWHYPSGTGIYLLRHGIDKPFGVTVSLKTQH